MPPTGDSSEYCEYKKNQYYDLQGEFCKRCDKCVAGWEKAKFQDSKFTIHPVHGAEGCLHCVRCGNGFYSESFSYEPCRPCRNCEQEGRLMEQKCSSSQNTVCGKSINKTTSASNKGLTTSEIHLIIGLSSAFVFSVIFIVLLCVCLKRRRKTGKKKGPKSVDSDINHALISQGTLSTCTNTTSGSSDVDTDGSNEPDTKITITAKVEKWISVHNPMEEFTCRHAHVISKSIAENNFFHQIGINLGLSDEDIKIIKIDYKLSVKEQAYETLIKWKHLKGSDATVIKFVEILMKLKLYKIAEVFCEEYDEEEKKIGTVLTVV